MSLYQQTRELPFVTVEQVLRLRQHALEMAKQLDDLQSAMKNPFEEPAMGADQFSVEPHGNGYALYYGRSGMAHGLNLMHITELDPKAGEPFLQRIVDCLNAGYSEIHGR